MRHPVSKCLPLVAHILLNWCSALHAAQPSWEILSVFKTDVGPAGLHWEKPIVEPRAACGLVKTGPGTLAITSEVKLTGIITRSDLLSALAHLPLWRPAV